MSTPTNSIQVKDGAVSTDPVDFAQALQLVRRDQLKSLWVRHDYLDKRPDPPMVNFSLLNEVAFIEDFGVSPNLKLKRIANFDAVYQLSKLKKLVLSSYKQLDLSRFPKLETLFVLDAPGLANWETLSKLRSAWIMGLRGDDLSFLSGMGHLSALRITQATNNRLRGLDLIPALSTLDVSHCLKLQELEALPKSLVKLTIKKCPRLRNLSFLASHPSLEFLYIDVMQTLEFVPSLRYLSYAGFENILDGDLRPLIKSASLQNVAFYPKTRKHYTHSLAELNETLAAKKTSVKRKEL